MKQHRHGDIYFEEVDKIPKNAKKIYSGSRFMVAEGEATGHHHTLTTEERENLIDVYEDAQGRRYIQLKSSASLSHQEHKEQTLETGIYFVKQEREYDYFLETVNQVKD